MKPMKFTSLDLRKISHEQLLFLVRLILTAWKKMQTIPPTVQRLINAIEPLMQMIDRILLAEKGSALTKTIREIDHNRDRAYRMLCKKIEDALDEFEPELVEAAELLMPVVEKFGPEITRLSYAEQSTSTTLAVTAFRSVERAAAMETLTVTRYLDLTDQFNTELIGKWDERASQSGGEDLPRLSGVRNEMLIHLRLLLKVTAFLHSDGYANVTDELIDTINSELVKQSALVKLRETREESAEA